MNRLRHTLHHRPRLLLAVVLAFGIELLSAPSALVRHHHAGGDRAHVHPGRVAAAPQVATSFGDGAIGAGTTVAIQRAAQDLHQHGAQPLVAMRAVVSIPTPVRFMLPLEEALAVAVVPAAGRAGQARAPPVIVA